MPRFARYCSSFLLSFTISGISLTSRQFKLRPCELFHIGLNIHETAEYVCQMCPFFSFFSETGVEIADSEEWDHYFPCNLFLTFCGREVIHGDQFEPKEQPLDRDGSI